MRSVALSISVVSLLAAGSAAADTPDLLWQFQGVENINAMAFLPDTDADGVPDVLVETYDAGASGDHIYLLSGGDTGVPAVLWSARPNSGVSNGGGYGDDCLAVCPDLNGDGFPDVVLGTAWGNRSVHAFDGPTGAVLWTFDTYNEFDSGWVYSVRSHPDRTGDRVPEVIAAVGSDNDSGYLLNGADGSVVWRFAGSNDAIGAAVSLPDVNADQFPDVLFGGWDNESRVFCVDGASEGIAGLVWYRDTAASNFAAALIDDVDFDGVADVVVGTWQASEQVFCLSGRTGQVLWRFHNGSYNYIMRLVAVDDVDGDGLRDVAVGSWGRGLPMISGADGSLIWMSYAGTTNGGDFWAVDRVDDVNGDGLADVVGGSFDTRAYLFDGASGDTLWIYDTPNRLFSVRGVADLSGNGVPDVLAGTQYLNGSGGKVYALEGGDLPIAVPDLPQITGRAGWLAGGRNGVELRWECDRPDGFLVDRIPVPAPGKTAGRKAELAARFQRGELTTREVLAEIVAPGDKTPSSLRLTPEPLTPLAETDGGWRYQFVDRAARPGSAATYRLSTVDDQGRETVVLELSARGDADAVPVLTEASAAPNPFNPRTVIRFSLDLAADVSLEIHDVRGRQVGGRPARSFAAGRHDLVWDGRGFGGRDLPAGVYLLTVRAGTDSRVVKTALVR